MGIAAIWFGGFSPRGAADDQAEADAQALALEVGDSPALDAVVTRNEEIERDLSTTTTTSTTVVEVLAESETTTTSSSTSSTTTPPSPPAATTTTRPRPATTVAPATTTTLATTTLPPTTSSSTTTTTPPTTTTTSTTTTSTTTTTTSTTTTTTTLPPTTTTTLPPTTTTTTTTTTTIPDVDEFIYVHDLRVERVRRDDDEWRARIRVEVRDQDGDRKHLDDVDVVIEWSGAHDGKAEGNTKDGRVIFETPWMEDDDGGSVTLTVVALIDDRYPYAPSQNRETSITAER